MADLQIFGEQLLKDGENVSFEKIKQLLGFPQVRPLYKISVLFPNESVMYEVPNSDISEDGIQFTESYQNGQRRNISLTLINNTGKYTPSVTGIWVNTRFSFEVGIQTYDGGVIWFPKGIYILGNVELSRGDSEKTVTFQLQDKYAIFEGKTGTLETAYEIELNSNIYDAVSGILNFTMGNGYVLDYKPVIFDPSFIGKTTQQTIRAEQGENYGVLIDALATQLSAEYYYNNVGNLCFYPINDTVNDNVKPVIWVYPWLGRDLHNMNLNYKNEEIVNVIKVVGDSIDNNIYSAVVENNNPASPICIGQVGRRTQSPYTNENVWSDDLARDLANYYLRKASFLGVEFSAQVSFNPILTCNNICEVEDKFLNLKREKLLITSISFGSASGQMSVNFCNTEDLPFMNNLSKAK